jgi:hypothetical protein
MSDLDAKQFERACRSNFHEHAGLLLRDGAWTPETLTAWKAQLRGDASAIEAAVNHFHIRQLFFDAEDYDESEVLSAAEELRECWTRTLNSMFPDGSFSVEMFAPTGAECDIAEFQLTVRRKRGAV